MNREVAAQEGTRALHPTLNRFRTRRLEAAAAGLALSAVAQPASAAIISSLDPGGDPYSLVAPDGVAAGAVNLLYSLGMMNEITLSLEIESVMSAAGDMGEMGTMNGYSFDLATFEDPLVNMSPIYLRLFQPGELVNNSLSFESQGALIDNDTVNPEWNFGAIQTGYAGFVFNNTDGTPRYYGWIQLEFDRAGADFTVLGWAYDDSGVALGAGVIPEPNTGLLLALGLAGLSAVARRRRRQRMLETRRRKTVH